MYSDFVEPMLAPSTGYLVWRLAMKWRAELDRTLAPMGITSAQYAVLATAAAHTSSGHQPSQRELADFVGLEAMFVSKLTRALERMGMVQRRRNPADTRALQIHVTRKGMAMVAAARSLVIDLERRRLAALDGADGARAAALNAALQTLLGAPLQTAHKADSPSTTAGRDS